MADPIDWEVRLMTSGVPSRWAVLDGLRRSHCLRSYRTLLRSQFDTPNELHERVRSDLASLLQTAAARPGLYRKLLAGQTIAKTNAEDVLRQLPLITKERIRSCPEDFVTTAKNSRFEKTTGGSTGEPLRYLMSQAAYSASWGHIWRSWAATGVDLRRPVGVIAGASVVGVPSYRRRLYFALNNWLVLSAFDLSRDAALAFAERLERSRAELIYGYASAILEFARWVDRPLSSLRAVVATAETLLQPVQAEIAHRLGVQVFNQYGANDGGIQCFQCRPGGQLHIGVERCFPEILGDDGIVRDVWSSGAELRCGELVLTDLLNTEQLFIRYRVGDRVTVGGGECACGRGLPTLRSVAGRTNECIVLPSGKMVHGEFFSHLFRVHTEITMFRVVQDDDAITVHLEMRPDSFERLESGLRVNIGARCPGVAVQFERHDRLSIEPGRKHALVTRSSFDVTAPGQAGPKR